MADNYRNTYAGPISRPVDQATFDVGLRKHMLTVYNYLASGLLLSGIVALLIYMVPSINSLFYTVQNGRMGFTGLGMVAVFAPLALLFLAMFTYQRMSAGMAQAFYWAFVGLQGVGLSVLLYAYTHQSVIQVFFITSAAFAGLSLYGYTTKRSLSAIGSFLIMGLIGLVIASIVNIFLASSGLAFIISIVGVLIFSGLIAYDTQRIKEQYAASWDRGTQDKVAIMAALGLYLDFINLFQFLLSIIGNRN